MKANRQIMGWSVGPNPLDTPILDLLQSGPDPIGGGPSIEARNDDAVRTVEAPAALDDEAVAPLKRPLLKR